MLNYGMRRKLLFAFLIASAVPAVLAIVLSIFSIKLQENAIYDLYAHQSQVIAQITKDRIDEYIQSIKQKLKLLQNDPEIIASFKEIEKAVKEPASREYQKAKEKLSAILTPLQRSMDMHDIFLIGQGGTTYFSSNASHYWKYLNKTVEETLGVHLTDSKDIDVTEIFNDSFKGNSVDLLVVSPLLNEQGNEIGKLAMEVPMDKINKMISERNGPGRTTEIFLAKITEDSILNASPINFNYNTIFKTRILEGSPENLMPEYSTEPYGYGTAEDYSKKNVLYYWQKVPQLNLTLLVETDTSEIFGNIDLLRKYTLLSSILITLLFTILAIYLASRITRPITKLVDGIKSESKEKFVPTIDPTLLASYDEIGILANSLKEKGETIEKYYTELQATHRQLMISEKMAALGNLVASVAHEVNSPLAAINGSITNIETSLIDLSSKLADITKNVPPDIIERLFTLLSSRQKNKTNLSTSQARKAKQQLIERLEENKVDSSELVGDLLWEMNIQNDPEPFLDCIQPKYGIKLLEFAYDYFSLRKNANTIKDSVRRASRIIIALKTYAHIESDALEKSEENVIDGIEMALMLSENQLKSGIDVIKNYDEVPTILCYPDELSQVWSNLIQNAIHAMNYLGRLTISVSVRGDYVAVKITDSGSGIPPEVMKRMFEPFYTTKPRGEGSGLGLNIVKEIIDKHGGKINVDSIPGSTTFTVLLPIKKA